MDVALPSEDRAAVVPAPRSSLLRFVVWLLHVALPLLGLWLLVAQPQTDLRWENHHAHFWLVFGVAAINVLLAGRIVDLVSSGQTLKENGLVETSRILDITARLIVNRAALKTDPRVAALVDAFRAQVQEAA